MSSPNNTYAFSTQLSSLSSTDQSRRPELVPRSSGTNYSNKSSLFTLGNNIDQPKRGSFGFANDSGFSQDFNRLDIKDDGEYDDADNTRNHRHGQGSGVAKLWVKSNRNRSNSALPQIFNRSRSNSNTTAPPSRPPNTRSFSGSSIGSSITGVGSKIKSTFAGSSTKDHGGGSDHGGGGSTPKGRSRSGSLLSNLPSPKMPWTKDGTNSSKMNKNKGSDFISLETEGMRALERERDDKHRDEFDDLDNYSGPEDSDIGRQNSDEENRRGDRRYRSNSNPFASSRGYSATSSPKPAVRFPSTFVSSSTSDRATSPQQRRVAREDIDPNRRERERDTALTRQRADSGKSESDRGLGIAIALYDFASQEVHFQTLEALRNLHYQATDSFQS